MVWSQPRHAFATSCYNRFPTAKDDGIVASASGRRPRENS